MRSLLLALALAAGPSWSSCDPVLLQHPLSDPAQAKPDPRLLGIWAGYLADGQSTLHVIARAEGQIDLVEVSAGSGDRPPTLAFQGFTTSAGGRTYLNLRQKVWTDPMNDKFTLSPWVVLLRVDLDAGGALTLSYLPNEGAEKAVAAGKLHAEKPAKQVFTGSDLVLTDPPAKVLAFLEQPEVQAAFKSTGTYHKVQLDFGKPPASPK
jgi:hypothetical protein